MNLLLAAKNLPINTRYRLLHLAALTERTTLTRHIALDRPYILLLTKGRGRILSGDQLYRLRENTLMFMPAEVSQSLLLEPGCRGYLLLADISGLWQERKGYNTIARNILGENTEGKLFQIREERLSSFTVLLDTIGEEIRSMRPYFSTFIELQITQLLIHAERQCISRDLRHCPGDSTDLCERLGQLIQENFVQYKTVRFYAKQLHLHPNHLNKLIKAYSGITVKDWIKNIVLIECKALLIHTTLSVKEIAVRLGFRSTHHLSKYFKRETAMNPVTFRKKYSSIEQVG
ncbi:MAG: hypothetical protein DI535_18275 [Citrobacter freundii]|nr:MAG: hypothetical protein DI535_18275 [Citrobacter freundii]